MKHSFVPAGAVRSMPERSVFTCQQKLWAGRVISTIPILCLIFSGVIKLMKIDSVVQSFNYLGYPLELAGVIGSLELLCVVLYVIPSTSQLGAILSTGFLGGAVASHLRLDDPLFSHVLFPVYIGALLWGGLYLRDKRLREWLSSRPDPR